MDKWMKATDSVFIDSANVDDTYRFSYRNSSNEVLSFYLDFIEIAIGELRKKIPLISVVKVDISIIAGIQKNGDTLIFDMGDHTILFAVDTCTNRAPDLTTVYDQARRWVASFQSGPPARQ